MQVKQTVDVCSGTRMGRVKQFLQEDECFCTHDFTRPVLETKQLACVLCKG